MSILKRLSQPSGNVMASDSSEGDAADKAVRTAILVHGGPEGEKITFQSGDGEIAFDDARIQRIVTNHNNKIMTLANEYGGLAKMPIGAFPPILDQHEDDSSHRIGGRLASLLRFEKRDVPGVGKNVACALADITFLGEDVVNRVKDGRIYHLSIGIDEKTDTLGETSTVIEPAAPGAMLLKNGKQKKQGAKMGKKKVSVMRLQAHTKRMALLSGLKSDIDGISKEVTKTNDLVKLTKREGTVTARLGGLMKMKKLTPAEAKGIDVKKLARLDDDSLNTVMSAFEARQDVIMSGQRGTTDAVVASDLAKRSAGAELKRLRAETKKDLKRLGAKLKSDEDDDHGKDHEMAGGNHEEEVNPGKDPGAVAGEGGDLSKHMAAMKGHLEKGDVESAKMAYGDMEKCMAGGPVDSPHAGMNPEDQEKSMGHVQSQVDQLSTQMARLAGVVNQLFDSEKEEGSKLEQGEDESDDNDMEPEA